ncbi:N/A [soil metagenome]
MLSTSARITIGSNVYLGMAVLITTSTHELGPPLRRAGELVVEPVNIEDGVWIGANVTILPGVTIGRGAVVAAGAVVANDLEPNGLYAGVPAVRKRELPPGVK